MDPVILSMIVAIIAVVLLLEFYKRQESRITNNLHNHNVKQLLTITALEHKFNDYDARDDNDRQLVANQITQLVNGYEKGEIPADVFQNQMDYLLNKLN
jgi:hypothetical protein